MRTTNCTEDRRVRPSCGLLHRRSRYTAAPRLQPSDPGWHDLGTPTTTIYEMGIPVAAVEWGVPFHVDVQQRVPMNPNRDAVSSGYPLKLHVACLPVLLEHMDEVTLKQDWVGAAGRRCDEIRRCFPGLLGSGP